MTLQELKEGPLSGWSIRTLEDGSLLIPFHLGFSWDTGKYVDFIQKRWGQHLKGFNIGWFASDDGSGVHIQEIKTVYPSRYIKSLKKRNFFRFTFKRKK